MDGGKTGKKNSNQVLQTLPGWEHTREGPVGKKGTCQGKSTALLRDGLRKVRKKKI